VSVKYATEHRCGVVVRGSGLSDAISGTDPLKDNLPLLTVTPLDDSPEVGEFK
jgi:2,3-bisphosphoglycerate-independent phosphoglycerate mutase